MNTNSRPNIFKYATKELSQDAMISWFLDCLRSDDENYRKLGELFIRDFILKDSMDLQSQCSDAKISNTGLRIQYYHMDVYAEIKIGNNLFPVIFEDKTDTFLHGTQLTDYCKRVSNWRTESYLNEKRKEFKLNNLEWGNVIYVYFKTGFELKQEIKNYEQQISTKELSDIIFVHRGLVDMDTFLSAIPVDDTLVSDYKEHIHNMLVERNLSEKVMEETDDEKIYKYLGNAAGACQIMENIYKEKQNWKFNHQGWSSKDTFVLCNRTDLYYDNQGGTTGKGNSGIWYYYRLDAFSLKNVELREKGYKYAISFRQYRNENKLDMHYIPFEKKIENYNFVNNKSKEILEELSLGTDLKVVYSSEAGISSKTYNEKEIFKVFIDSKSIMAVCDFVDSFDKKIKKIVKSELADEYIYHAALDEN